MALLTFIKIEKIYINLKNVLHNVAKCTEVCYNIYTLILSKNYKGVYTMVRNIRNVEGFYIVATNDSDEVRIFENISEEEVFSLSYRIIKKCHSLMKAKAAKEEYEKEHTYFLVFEDGSVCSYNGILSDGQDAIAVFNDTDKVKEFLENLKVTATA